MKPGIGNRESGIGKAPIPVRVPDARPGHGACIRAHMHWSAAISTALSRTPEASGRPLLRFPIPHSPFPAF